MHQGHAVLGSLGLTTAFIFADFYSMPTLFAALGSDLAATVIVALGVVQVILMAVILKKVLWIR